ncbi:MAG: 4Fe-4S dicluster domain-containing protein [Alkaliphilus sp.]
MTMTEKMRNQIRELFEKKEIKLFIGFEKGFEKLSRVPAFAENYDEAKTMIIDEFETPLLAKYLIRELGEVADGIVEKSERVAILTRGCDYLGIRRLIVDNIILRENIVIVGIPCDGLIDVKKANNLLGEESQKITIDDENVIVKGKTKSKEISKTEVILDRCKQCIMCEPEESDIILAEKTANSKKNKDYSEIEEIEKMSAEERYEFWSRQFGRCIRCFACRDACTACNCRKCIFDITEPEMLEKTVATSEQFMFHFIRAFHVAGRCTACGECERVCPVDIPLGLLNGKFKKDIEFLFDVEDAGIPSEIEPLGEFKLDDPVEW